jgi:hypothetical protein
MKSTLLKSAVLLASVFGALGSASAETLHARIPFAFSAAGISMPAGTYTIRTMPNARQVLLFENEETRAQFLVFARTASGLPAKTAPPLTFTDYSGEKMELANIAASDWTYELNTYPARKALKAVALTLTSGGK